MHQYENHEHDLHEVFWIFTQGHVQDIESIRIVFLSGQQEGEEMQRVSVVSLKLKSLTNVTQSFWYLFERNTDRS